MSKAPSLQLSLDNAISSSGFEPTSKPNPKSTTWSRRWDSGLHLIGNTPWNGRCPPLSQRMIRSSYFHPFLQETKLWTDTNPRFSLHLSICMWQFGTSKVRWPILVNVKDYVFIGPTSTFPFKYEREWQKWLWCCTGINYSVASPSSWSNSICNPNTGITRDRGPSKSNASLQRWTPWTGADKLACSYHSKGEPLDSHIVVWKRPVQPHTPLWLGHSGQAHRKFKCFGQSSIWLLFRP